jgi:hypothetical protein
MSTCPSCGSAEDGHQEQPRLSRARYVCGSYTYTANPKWNYQSDLCIARHRIRNVRNIVTTDAETKEQLIARVRAILQE